MTSNLFGGVASVGMSAATGNYVSAGLSLLGLGVSLLGGNQQAEDAKRAADLSMQNAQLEGDINEQKHTQMVVSSRRQQLEIIRNTQRARAMGLQASVTQGAQFGSGISGGQAEDQAMGFYNLKGVNNNVEIGENIFALNRKISANKIGISQAQSDMAADAGLAAVGGAISKSADPLGRLSGQLFSGSNITLGTPNGPTPFV